MTVRSLGIALILLWDKKKTVLVPSMGLFAHCRDPEILKVGVVLQFFVLRNRFFRDGVDDAAAIFFDVYDWLRPL